MQHAPLGLTSPAYCGDDSSPVIFSDLLRHRFGRVTGCPCLEDYGSPKVWISAKAGASTSLASLNEWVQSIECFN